MPLSLSSFVFQFVDSAGKPYSGGSLSFFESGTSTSLDTYSDSALSTANANPLTLNSAGFPDTNIFLQNKLYRVVLKDSSGNTIFTRDNVSGTDFTPASADVGAVVLFKVGSGSPNGNVSGTAGSSGVLPSLYWDYTNSTLYACTTTGTSSTAVWTAEIGPSRNQLAWTIKDIVTAAPAQDDEGTSYIVGSAFGSFSTGDIITDNGEGEFTVTQPVSDGGWIAYVQDEDRYYAYIGSSWAPVGINVDGLAEDTDPDSDDDFVATWDESAEGHKKVPIGMLPGSIIAIIEDQKAQNTAAQTLTADTDNVRELNTLDYNRDTIVSLSNDQFTLPAGTWEIEWYAPVGSADKGEIAVPHQSFLYNATDSSEVKRGVPGRVDTQDNTETVSQPSLGSAVVTITASKAFEIRHRPSGDSILGGEKANIDTEVYTRVIVRRA